MKPEICISLPFLDPQLEASMTQAAEKAGFSMGFFTNEQLYADPAPLQRCEIFMTQDYNLLRLAGPNLKWFASPNAGVDTLCYDGTHFANPHCLLTNGAGAYGRTISEHLVMVILMLMRNMPAYITTNTSHQWGPPISMRSIHDCQVTILGTGNIGTTFAHAMRGLGAKRIVGLSRSGTASDPVYDQVLPIGQLDSLLGETEVLVLALPNTKETQNVLSRERIAMLRPDALVCNVGRGPAVDQEALMEALNNDKIAGAALDVMVPEPLPQDHPLWDTKNLILTPHISGNMTLGYTRETVINTFCANLQRYAAGEALTNLVDRSRAY